MLIFHLPITYAIYMPLSTTPYLLYYTCLLYIMSLNLCILLHPTRQITFILSNYILYTSIPPMCSYCAHTFTDITILPITLLFLPLFYTPTLIFFVWCSPLFSSYILATQPSSSPVGSFYLYISPFLLSLPSSPFSTFWNTLESPLFLSPYSTPSIQAHEFSVFVFKISALKSSTLFSNWQYLALFPHLWPIVKQVYIGWRT